MSRVGEDAPPPELVVDAKAAPGDSSDGAGTAMAPFAVPVVAAGLLAKYASLTLAALGLGLGIAVVIALRKPREGRFVLRVDDGVLEVGRERASGPSTRVPLDDLLDVTLDRQTRQASGRGGSATERVRLAFEQRGAEDPIFVPDERITPLEAQEWHSKVRVFLRKHGWVPDDER